MDGNLVNLFLEWTVHPTSARTEVERVKALGEEEEEEEEEEEVV